MMRVGPGFGAVVSQPIVAGAHSRAKGSPEGVSKQNEGVRDQDATVLFETPHLPGI